MGCLLILGAVEVTMRGVGRFLLRPQGAANAVQPSDLTAFRILTLGESTTADFFARGEDLAWPRQLERALRLEGYAVRVYNEAVPGTSTPFILAALESQLDAYRPHLVITMMGVNDFPGFRYGGGVGSRFGLFLRDLRLVKVFAWTRAATQAVRTPDGTRVWWERERPGFVPAVPNIAATLLAGDGERGAREIVQFLRSAPVDTGEFYFALSEAVSGDSTRLALEFVSRAVEYHPEDDAILADYFALAQESRAWHLCRNRAGELLRRGTRLSGPTLTRVIACRTEAANHGEVGNDRETVDLLKRHGVEIGRTSADDTGFHYRRVYAFLRQRDVPLVAMQYPTWPVSDLRLALRMTETGPGSDDGGILFVDNEDNFRNALTSVSYDELFTDRFAGTWGHFTAEGHRMVTERLMRALETAGMIPDAYRR